MGKHIGGKNKVDGIPIPSLNDIRKPKAVPNLNKISNQLNSGPTLTANYTDDDVIENYEHSTEVNEVPIETDVGVENKIDNELSENENVKQLEAIVKSITKNNDRKPIYNYSMNETGSCKIEALGNKVNEEDEVEIHNNPIKVESEGYINIVKRLIDETTERIKCIQIERKVCEVLMRSNVNYKINNDKYIQYTNDLKEQQSRLSALKSLLMR